MKQWWVLWIEIEKDDEIEQLKFWILNKAKKGSRVRYMRNKQMRQNLKHVEKKKQSLNMLII